MDDRIGDIMLDAGLAIVLSAVATQLLRALLAFL
jgi:hypothetical protein